jgi:type VI secretion system secreted protein Hcp
MAQTVHLFLKANGKAVDGESTVASLGRAKSIECVWYEQAVATAREAGTNMVTGRRHYQPVKFLKRIDKSSPVLLQALTANQKIEAVFKFYRPNPAGDGTTQHFYTVALADGNVSAIRQYLPSTIDPATVGNPPLEQVEFVFRKITVTYEDGGVTHEDSWAESK